MLRGSHHKRPKAGVELISELQAHKIKQDYDVILQVVLLVSS